MILKCSGTVKKENAEACKVPEGTPEGTPCENVKTSAALYQDELYGKDNRVHNAQKAGTTQAGCTICGTYRTQAGRDDISSRKNSPPLPDWTKSVLAKRAA